MRIRILSSALLCSIANRALTQTPAPRGAIDGIVSDTALRPLANATAWILGTGLELTTRENGRFRMLSVPAGEYVVVVRRIGYAPFSTVLRVPAADTVRPSFILEPAEVSLDTIKVTAIGGVAPGLREFETRRAQGFGQFMTEKQIDKLQMAGVSGLLRTFQGVTVTPDNKGAFNSRFGSVKSCPYQFVVDGVLYPTPRDMDAELPRPQEIAGIEVYANTASVPPQYASTGNSGGRGGGAFCGVIAVWTKR